VPVFIFIWRLNSSIDKYPTVNPEQIPANKHKTLKTCLTFFKQNYKYIKIIRKKGKILAHLDHRFHAHDSCGRNPWEFHHQEFFWDIKISLDEMIPVGNQLFL
jgi:hypothetical protein